MITTADARQQAKDLIAVGDPHRSIVVMSTPAKLGVLHVHLAHYATMVHATEHGGELLKMLNEIRDDVQRTVTQILQSQYPPS